MSGQGAAMEDACTCPPPNSEVEMVEYKQGRCYCYWILLLDRKV